LSHSKRLPITGQLHPGATAQSSTQAFVLALIGIAIFSATLPVSRLAIQELSAPFVAVARAAIAGLLAATILVARRVPTPSRPQWGWIALTALGVVFGFPYFSTLAMQTVAASHAAIITGILPLCTALMGTWLARERPNAGFWFWAALGCAMVVGFAYWRGGGQPVRGDWAMLAAVVLGAIGYAAGGKLASSLGGINTICWALIISLPINIALSLYYRPANFTAVSFQSWLCLSYLAVFSMLIGFFFWYNALAMGGIAKISLVQLLQPFMTVMMASAINREPLQWPTIFMALAVAFVVFNGRRA
jgi:drug/metabolite transporter (DMT)-like permease